MDDQERLRMLEEVAAQVASCESCRLHESATNAVPGEGPIDAPVMFIGEAPGHQEDRQGRPFVGPAGQLLDRLLVGIGLSRDEVFITNVVKHRPPGNRDPETEEIEACRGFLERQIELVAPTVIATLGRFAMERYLPGARIGQVHGQPRKLGDRIFLPMLHPAAALRRREWRTDIEHDFESLQRVLSEDQPSLDEAPPQDPSGEQLSLF